MLDLKRRKLPRQERSRAKVDAILEAAAHLLRDGGYAALTTNHIAERAGVSIGTLYQFFPGKEAVVASLAERTVDSLFATVVSELPSILEGKGLEPALDLLVRRLMAVLGADRRLHAVLLREVPFLRDLPVIGGTVEALITVSREEIEPWREHVALEDLDAEVWLIGRMAYEVILGVAVFGEGPVSSERATKGFVRLLLRMIRGR